MARLFFNKTELQLSRDTHIAQLQHFLHPFKIFLTLLLAITITNMAFADTRCENPAAILESAEGTVEWAVGDTDTWQKAARGASFCYGDKVRVLEQRAALRLANETLVRLQENSLITLLPEEKGFWFGLLEGAGHFLSRTSKQFTIKAPYLNAAVDGTEFVVIAQRQENRVAVVEGTVRVNNDFGEVRLSDGTQTSATANSPPSAIQSIRLRDAAEWVLYYPPLLAQATSSAIERLIEHERYNDALDALTQNALTVESATLAASLAFNSWQPEKAEQYLQSALAQNPKFADALALQALRTLIKGDDVSALAQTTHLLQIHPNNPSVLLAYAYAVQSQGEIEKALTVNRQALELIPDDLFALARTAELELSAGNASAARKLVNKALQKSPRHSRTNTLAGFIALNRFANKDAQKYFQTAIETNSSEPLARFGLALALIQKGKIEQGRQQMEMAVLLDPGSSLLRGYLGKTYATQNKNDWADTQYQLAKNLDPNDPTPWFYSALQNQNEGNLIRAARDLEESQSLNNNRLVYRSRFYLDRDAASRAANAGRVYNELGFTKKAIDLGTKAIHESPSENSGHRLLAEIYSNNHRYDSLRASERLQATLLQPVGTTPLPLGLSETGLLVADGMGPSDIGFGEYTRLFITEGFNGQASILKGGQNTDAYNVNVTGTGSNAAISLGHYDYQTDGFRKNSDASYAISNLLTQWQVQPSFSMIAEISERKEEYGDLGLRLSYDNFFENRRTKSDISTYRIGANLTTEKAGQFLFSATNRHFRSDYEDETTRFITSRKDSSETDIFDFRYNYQNSRGSLIIGALIADNQSIAYDKRQSRVSYNESSRITDLYAYQYIRIKNQLHLMYGIDFIQKPTEYSFNELNLSANVDDKYLPKFGLNWNPSETLDLSLAYFEARTNLKAIQTSLKPTHILNFPQLLEGAEGSTIDTLAGSAALKPDSRITFGYTYDTSTIAYAQLSPGIRLAIISKRLETYNQKLFIDKIINDSTSINITASSERMQRDRNIIDFTIPLQLKNEKIVFGFNWNITNKIHLNLKQNYISQVIHMQNSIDNSENVLTTDIEIKRHFSYGSVKLSALNIFDKDFNYSNFDIFGSTSQPRAFFPELTFIATASFSL